VHKLDVLRQHCDDVGRDFNSIAKTVTTRIPLSKHSGEGKMSPNQAVDHIGRFTDLGFSDVLIMTETPPEHHWIELFGADVIPVVSKLGALVH
jgi:hypothetical protein